MRYSLFEDHSSKGFSYKNPDLEFEADMSNWYVRKFTLKLEEDFPELIEWVTSTLEKATRDPKQRKAFKKDLRFDGHIYTGSIPIGFSEADNVIEFKYSDHKTL